MFPPKYLSASTVKHWRNCQHCYKGDSKDDPLLICVCKHARYCNKDCQKADWKIHKPVCLRNRAATSSADQFRQGEVDMLELSKKWVQIRKGILGQSTISALDLHTHPERINTHILVLAISPTFASKPPKLDKEIAVAFKVDEAFVYPIDKMLETCSEELREGTVESMKSLEEKAKVLKNKMRGVVGFGLTQIIISNSTLIRMSPVLVQRPLPPPAANWKEVLENTLKSPRLGVQIVQVE